MKYDDVFDRIIKEDPDQVKINNDELIINTHYDGTMSDDIYGFGFLNTNIVYRGVKIFEKIKDMHGELVIGRGLSHGIIKRKFFENLKHGIIKSNDIHNQFKDYDLSDPEQHRQFLRTVFMHGVDSRIVFSPSGRIWTNVKNKVTGKPVVLISFWAFKDKQKNKTNDPKSFGPLTSTIAPDGYEVNVTHIKRILNKVGIPRNDWNDTYLEFLEDDYEGSKKHRMTLREFTRQGMLALPSQEKTKEQEEKDKEMVKQGQEKIKIGAHGNPLNPNFGSRYQADKASKSGLPSYAEYHATKNPYRESVSCQ